MYSMLVADIDGTLLDDRGKVPEDTKIAINTLKERGFIITIATGRMLKRAEPVAREIGINFPLICYNGAFVTDIYNRRVLLEKPITTAALVYALNHLKCWNYDAVVFENETLITEKITENTKWYIEKCHGVGYDFVGDLPGYVKQKNVKSYKIYAMGDIAGERDVPADLMARLSSFFEVAVADKNHLEITLKGITKGNAVNFLADANELPHEKIIAVGDDHNDVSMIKRAGLGIAMGNAPEAIKSCADYITGTNSDNGILAVLKKFVL
jgi:Cof subfamily protein (haloacid dehalogenase superfamily)